MIYRVVLDVQLLKTQALGKTIGADKRGIPGMKTGLRFAANRQKLPEAPHVPGAPLDVVTRQCATDGVVIVSNLQRSKTLIADPQRLGREFRPAQMALQPCHER